MPSNSASSSSTSSFETPQRVGVSSTPTTAFLEFLRQAEDDDVVCAFGPDYFRGASLGAFGGSILTGLLCRYTFRILKADQREVDFLSGLRRGQRNRHFSSWTLLRGLRTQPMLTVGCMALGVTSTMKCVKCFLASRRCREFYADDVEFARLQSQSGADPKASALLEAIEREAVTANATISPLALKSAAVAELHKQPTSTGSSSASPPASPSPVAASTLKPGISVQELLNAHDSNRFSGAAGSTKLIHRCPTFWDGVAVAFLGSVMDCYLPQKPVLKYYNMHVGLW
jgi:hypothetical protein